MEVVTTLDDSGVRALKLCPFFSNTHLSAVPKIFAQTVQVFEESNSLCSQSNVWIWISKCAKLKHRRVKKRAFLTLHSIYEGRGSKKCVLLPDYTLLQKAPCDVVYKARQWTGGGYNVTPASSLPCTAKIPAAWNLSFQKKMTNRAGEHECKIALWRRFFLI